MFTDTVSGSNPICAGGYKCIFYILSFIKFEFFSSMDIFIFEQSKYEIQQYAHDESTLFQKENLNFASYMSSYISFKLNVDIKRQQTLSI